VLKAALLMRAKEDIRRLMALRQSKNSLQALLQRGCVGDDLWTRFSAADAENEEELRDVVMEANAYKEGWGLIIFQTASEMVNHDRIRLRAAQVGTDAEEERKWWDEKRARSARELADDTASDSENVVGKKGGGKTKK